MKEKKEFDHIDKKNEILTITIEKNEKEIGMHCLQQA
jgi:hypothetical protein